MLLLATQATSKTFAYVLLLAFVLLLAYFLGNFLSFWGLGPG